MEQLIVGMTGASGSILAVRLLESLREIDVETHLVISERAQRTLEHETSYKVRDVQNMATRHYAPGDMAAAISSASFIAKGMVVVPCSMRSLAAMALGSGDHLVHRAADVVLRERRQLVLVTREMPLNEVHIENMLKLYRMGCTILPPMPAFYNFSEAALDIVDHVVARILDLFGLAAEHARRWDGHMWGGSKIRRIEATLD